MLMLESDGRLRARAKAYDWRLQQVISAALQASPDMAPEIFGIITLTGSNGNMLQMWARPLSKGNAIVFATNPNVPPARLENALQRLYQLTPAEARLAAALAAGESVQCFAARTGVTEGTARHHLKHVLAKTETHRQADLMRLIFTGPAMYCCAQDAKGC
jgi:DNA-binding CsgD family transcriptional regulator